MIPPKVLREKYPNCEWHFIKVFNKETYEVITICDCQVEHLFHNIQTLIINESPYRAIRLKSELWKQHFGTFDFVRKEKKGVFPAKALVREGMIDNKSYGRIYEALIYFYHGQCDKCKCVFWSFLPYPNSWNEYLEFCV